MLDLSSKTFEILLLVFEIKISNLFGLSQAIGREGLHTIFRIKMFKSLKLNINITNSSLKTLTIPEVHFLYETKQNIL